MITPVGMKVRAKSTAAKGAMDSPEIFVTASSDSKADAIEPKETAQACPRTVTMTERTGSKPIPTRMGAQTATGTPNPPMPCKKEVISQAISSSWMERSLEKRGISRPIVRMVPASLARLNSSRALQTMISRFIANTRALTCDQARMRQLPPKAIRLTAAATSQLIAPARNAPHLKRSIRTITVRIGKKDNIQLPRLSSIGHLL